MAASVTSPRPRRLAIEEHSWDHWEGQVLGAMMAGLGLFTIGASVGARAAEPETRVFLSVVGALILVPGFAAFYTMGGMRGAIWEDGFRPSGSDRNLRAVTYLRRGMRAKIRWNEIQRLTLQANEAQGTPGGLSILLAPRDEVTLGIGGSASHACVSLLVLERWVLLGGSVSRVDTDDRALPGEREASLWPWAGTPTRGASSAAADRAAWQIYERVAGPARVAFVDGLAQARLRTADQFKARLVQLRGNPDRIVEALRAEREAEEQYSREAAPMAAVYGAAIEQAASAYRAALATVAGPTPGPPNWMPRGGSSPDEGTVYRAAQRSPRNDVLPFLMMGGLAVASVPATAWSAATGERPIVVALLLILAATGTWGTLWMARLNSDEHRFFVLLPRLGSSSGAWQVLPPGRSRYFNPLAWRAVDVWIHDEFCRVEAPATTKDGVKFTALGLVAFAYEWNPDALLRAAQFHLSEDASKLNRWLEKVTVDVSSAMIAERTSAELEAAGGRLPDEEARRRVDATVAKRGLRMQQTGFLGAFPRDMVDQARLKALKDKAAIAEGVAAAREVKM